MGSRLFLMTMALGVAISLFFKAQRSCRKETAAEDVAAAEEEAEAEDEAAAEDETAAEETDAEDEAAADDGTVAGNEASADDDTVAEGPDAEETVAESPNVHAEVWKTFTAVEEELFGKGHLHRSKMGNYADDFLGLMIDYFVQVDDILRAIRLSVVNCDLVSIKRLVKSMVKKSESFGALWMVNILKTMEVLDDMERMISCVEQLKDELSLIKENVVMLWDLDNQVFTLMRAPLGCSYVHSFINVDS